MTRDDRSRRKPTQQDSSMRERARKRAEDREFRGGGGTKFNLPTGSEVKFFIPKKGSMNLDILPYRISADNHPEVPKGELWYQRTIYTHYGVGPEEQSYICPKTTKHRCPICEEHSRLAKDPSADEKLVKSLKPKERELYNVVDLANESAGVQLWDMSYYLFGQKLEEEIREGDEAWAGFADLKGGFTLKVRFSDKSFAGNTFLEVSRVDFESREEYPENVLDKVIDLDAILNILPYEKLHAIFLGVEGEEGGEGEGKPPETPPATSSGSSLRGGGTLKGKGEPVEAPSTRKEKGTTASTPEECPHKGQFGVDTDELDACDKCKVWDKCMDAKEASKGKKEKKGKKEEDEDAF